MNDADLHIRCMRCGDQMELRDPAPGMPDGQADPWGPRAQREAPPIRS